MCCSTKEKIASVLRELSADRSLKRITVQNVMDAADMKRQSFYYHFKDIHDVLLWIYRRDIVDPLSSSQLPFDQWVIYGYSLLDRDRGFYRKLLSYMQPDFPYELHQPLIKSRIAEMLFHTPQLETLNEQQCFVVDFFSRALISHLNDFVYSRRSFDADKATANIQCLLDTIGCAVPEATHGSVLIT